ncbi:MAG: M20/M25/M40 family metallo-hydrolase [Acidobacteria bacterium]|nr:M20/M25/M40 family metallo-hydrolase [Acidobacteriota bacterium]
MVPHTRQRDVLTHIDSQELVDLALSLSNIDSPPGREKPVADHIYEWLRRKGFEAHQVGLLPERPNVVGRLKGRGDGPSLILNAHMDTAWGPEERKWMHEPDHPFYTTAWREGEVLVGNGLVNDKGPLACCLAAAKAIKEAGVELSGDLIVTAVCGEIGQEPVDEFAAPTYLSKETGTRYLVEHGVIGDLALVAEATSFGVTWVEAGKAFFKITVLGDRSRYTPYVDHPENPAENCNALVRMLPVVSRLEEWARRYCRDHTYSFRGGTCVPQVSLGAVRGGQPYIPIVTAERAYLYLNVRLTPAPTAMQVHEELIRELESTGVPTNVECTLYRRGYEAQGVEPLLEAVQAAHQAEFETELPPVSAPLCSMWRDTNPFNELGIPAVTYGPGGGVGGGMFQVKIDDLVHAARIYALVALDLCGRSRK